MPPDGPALLITRPEPAGGVFALRVIEALGRPVRTILSPVIAIAPVAIAPPAVTPAGLVLTSVHGAQAAGRMQLPAGLPAWCVGAQTAQAARAAGFHTQSADGDAGALIGMILSRPPGGPLLHVRGAHVTGDVAARLGAGGVECAEVIGYRQGPLPLTAQARAALAGTAPVVLPLFSPRSVSILAQNAPFQARITAIAISPAVAEAAAELGPATLILADRPDGAAMCAATCRAIVAISMPSGP